MTEGSTAEVVVAEVIKMRKSQVEIILCNQFRQRKMLQQVKTQVLMAVSSSGNDNRRNEPYRENVESRIMPKSECYE